MSIFIARWKFEIKKSFCYAKILTTVITLFKLYMNSVLSLEHKGICTEQQVPILYRNSNYLKFLFNSVTYTRVQSLLCSEVSENRNAHRHKYSFSCTAPVKTVWYKDKIEMTERFLGYSNVRCHENSFGSSRIILCVRTAEQWFMFRRDSNTRKHLFNPYKHVFILKHLTLPFNHYFLFILIKESSLIRANWAGRW